MTTTWHGWFGLGGQITGTPAVVFPTPHTIDVYARGTDGRLMQKWWDGAKWGPSDSDWLPHEDNGFRLGSSPAVLARADFRDVYVRGADGRVYHKFWDGKQWHGWFGLGGEIKGAPAAVNPTLGTIDVYVQGMDDRLWQKWWDGTKWNPSDDGWLQHDDGSFRLGSSPVVVSRGANHRAVYARGQNGSLFHKVWNGAKWSAWLNLGGVILGTPAVVQANPTFHDVYARGPNNRLWQKWWDGTKWNPSELGWVMHHDGNVRIDGPPSVAASGDGDRDVYVRSTSGTVLHKFWNGQRHSNAQEIRENANNSAWIDAAAKSQTGPGKPGLAVAVIKNGRIVHLAGYGTANLATGAPITSETMFHAGSCGKALTALGIMMLKEQGKLNYDDHIGKHIPELKGYPPGVTLRRMMQQMSGILDLYALNTGTPPTNASAIQAAVDNDFPMDPEVFGPGDKFKYINSGYDLLGSVIERVTGWSYPVFYNFRVFDMLGMTDTFSLPETSRLNDSNRATGYDPNGSGSFIATPSFQFFDRIVGAGSFYTSVFDLCALEEALESNFLVSSLQDAYTKGKTNFGVEIDYGFGWFLKSESGKIFAEHDGAWNGYLARFRRCLDRRLSIYILTNHTAVDHKMVADVAMDAYA